MGKRFPCFWRDKREQIGEMNIHPFVKRHVATAEQYYRTSKRNEHVCLQSTASAAHGRINKEQKKEWLGTNGMMKRRIMYQINALPR